MKRPKVNKAILYRFISLAVLAIAFLLPINKAYAISCKDGKPPVKEASCFFGGCAVCDDPKTTWNHPKVAVVYEVFGIFPVHGSIGLNKCRWLAGIRFCARAVNPGTKEEGNEKNRFGNTTGDPLNSPFNPRPQLCAYEDSMDGMDTNSGSSPHYEHEKNTGGINATQGAVFGAAGGPVGMGIGALVGAIMAYWNHVVITNIGCVDRPIAVGPPVFSNDAWNVTYLPRPFIENAADSTFLKPVITLSLCQDPSTKELIDCAKDAEGKLVNVVQSFTLSPIEGNAYDDRKTASVSYTEGGLTKKDDREFSATISTSDPSEICVYKTKEQSSFVGPKGVNVFQGCVGRPGYMPMPTVVGLASGAGSSSDKMSVSFEGAPETIQIWPNPRNFDPAATNDPGNECKTLHQITFCAVKKCTSRAPTVVTVTENGDEISTVGDCVQWDNKSCLAGYETAPVVLAKAPLSALDGIDGAPIPVAGPPLGNVSKAKGVAFVNTYANPEMIAGVSTPISLKPKKNILIYEPKQCYEKDETGKCVNYDGKCEKIDNGKCIKYVNNATSDPYLIDVGSNDPETGAFVPSATVIRQVSPEELGICSTTTQWVKTLPGTYTYTVPADCKKVAVELWGAGGGGKEGGSKGDDWSGGAGGYIKGTMSVTPNQSLTVLVGRGGDRYKKGDDTVLSGKMIAYGGSPKNGGSSSCSAGVTCLAADKKDGKNGYNKNCGTMTGAAVWNPDLNAYEQWLTGDHSDRKQCDGKKSFDPDLHIADVDPLNVITNYIYPAVNGVGGCSSDECDGNDYKGNVGVGGHGKARISCIE